MKKFLALLTVFTAFTACVTDDDFETPDLSIEEPVLEGDIVQIGSVLGNLAQSDEGIYTYSESNLFLEGYVISSDEGGNFFEELVIQDKAENPTAGVIIQVDVNPLFTKFDFGRKVYLKLDGLSVTVDNGVAQIGTRSGNGIEKIAPSLIDGNPNDANINDRPVLRRSSEVATIVPLEVNIADFSNELENLYVRVNDVQFNRNIALGDNRLTFASEPTDEFDGERLLESCASGETAIVSTSTFSDFKGQLLPQGSGSINAVLSRDFFDDFYILSINSPEDILFDGERCDPIELACGLADSEGSTELFADDFETQSTFSPITGNGWTNYIQAGTQTWEAYTAGGTNSSQGVSARVGSFRSGDDSSIAWLISPAIDLDANTGTTLSFETSNSFSDGSTLEVLFSKDWDGTEAGVATATWGVLSDAYVVQDSDYFGDWFDSGLVDLSCETGTIHIAFKFKGSGEEDFDGTYELDNVKISAQ